MEINAEVRTNQGRIDAVIETDEAVFIFEFKLGDEQQVAITPSPRHLVTPPVPPG